MTSKREIEKRIEEQEADVDVTPDEEKTEFQLVQDSIEDEHGEDAAFEALQAVVLTAVESIRPGEDDLEDEWVDPTPDGESAFDTDEQRQEAFDALGVAWIESDFDHDAGSSGAGEAVRRTP